MKDFYLMDEREQAIADAKKSGRIAVQDWDGNVEGFFLYDEENLKDVFGRCDGDQIDFDVIEDVFARAEQGITFDDLKAMLEEWQEEKREE